jgi:hypothetical protein
VLIRRRGNARDMRARRYGVALVVIITAFILAGSASGLAQPTPEATPLSQATVDDVTIALLSWSAPVEGGGVFEAKIALTNRSGDPVTIDPEVVLVTKNDQGNIGRIQLTATPGPECSVGDGERIDFIFRGDLNAGEKPDRLILGLIELHRSGGRVEFPLNGDGASAFGGSGKPGGNAGGGTPISGSNATTPASATPGGATPASPQDACDI